MSQIEQHAHPAAGEHPGAHHAEDEGGTGVIAEGEQPFGLRLGTHPRLVEADGRFGPYGIASDEAQGKGAGAGAADVEHRAHDPLQQPPQIARQAQLHHQRGENEKGEQGGNDDVIAQQQPVFGGLYGVAGIEQQRQRGTQQGRAQQHFPHPLPAKQSGHETHLLHK